LRVIFTLSHRLHSTRPTSKSRTQAAVQTTSRLITLSLPVQALSVDARLGAVNDGLGLVLSLEFAAELLDLGRLLFDYRLKVSDELAIGAVVGADDGAVPVVAGLARCLQVRGVEEQMRVR
jgi:hypothetical protein